ncbi:radical SAM protein [Candidatus Brocadia pituitae]|nr:radical SAM protein [Candidatus Brocadia pituitae]
MRNKERWKSLVKSPETIWNLLFLGKYNFYFDFMPAELKRMSLKKQINLIMFGLNLIHRRIHPWSWPIHMQVEITNYCNLKCPICPTGNKTLNRPPMNIDICLFESLMDEVGPYLLTLALYAWGEPLLHPQLSEILKITSKHNIVTLLSTNGQNLEDNRVLEALIHYPTTYLIVAMDGLTDKTNSLFRRGAKLEHILGGVKKLAEMKRKKGSALPIIHMRYIIMKHNQHEYPFIKEFAEDNMFDFLSIRTLSPIDSPEIPYMEFVPNTKEFSAYTYKNDKRLKLNNFICMHAFNYPTVFSNGCVVSCEQDFNAQQPYGMISRNVSFKDIWFSKRAATIRKTIRDTPSNYTFCLNCPFADRPISSCSIEAYDLRNIHNHTL